MKYHSTVGERERVEKLGLGKNDTGSAAGFNDIDEVMASSTAEWKRPWWVRRVDNPTVEIDWDVMERFDARKIQQVSWRKYVGEDKARELNRRREEKMKKWILEKRPGYTLLDRALDIAGSQGGSVGVTFQGSWAKTGKEKPDNTKYFTKDPTTSKLRDPARARPLSPQEMGVPRYEGSPEENSRMVRAALRHFGADQVGFVELDDRTRKFIYSNDALDGKALEFENVEQAYETEKKRVIPDRARWVIVFSVQLSEELIKRRDGFSPTAFSSSTTGDAYGRARNILDRFQNFIHILGYQGLMGTWFNGLGIAPAFGVMAGLGELSRLNRMISPEYGPLQRLFKIVTDLPLAPTKPIDAGIMRFCRTCKVCAEKCPANVLSLETEPSWEVVGPWNNPGHRTWYENSVACRTWWAVSTAGCSTCFAVCPFSKKDRSFMHKIVKATISVNPVMPGLVNGLITQMDEIFGYQKERELESWWNLNMPTHGVDNTRYTQLK
ncbi:MAG: reductive dehalogenase [Deltaproteobacteria bacterium]|nr:reductive dehalogenase [Deltaproteobacteria bacterium]